MTGHGTRAYHECNVSIDGPLGVKAVDLGQHGYSDMAKVALEGFVQHNGHGTVREGRFLLVPQQRRTE